jgi:hypothetical protein
LQNEEITMLFLINRTSLRRRTLRALLTVIRDPALPAALREHAAGVAVAHGVPRGELHK